MAASNHTMKIAESEAGMILSEFVKQTRLYFLPVSNPTEIAILKGCAGCGCPTLINGEASPDICVAYMDGKVTGLPLCSKCRSTPSRVAELFEKVV